MESKQNLPESFLCPLTQEIMKDPVMDPEGNSYERAAITDWLSKNSTSPITRNPLKVEELVPNRALKETMEALLFGKVDAHVKNPQANPGSSTKSDLKIEAVSRDGNTMISIIPPASKAGVKRTPSNIVCVIDVSGSMASEAKIQNEQGKNEGFGLSILDLVKHAVRTIIGSLDTNDRLSLVSFTTEAKVCLGLTQMDAKGKKKAEEALEAMKPEDSTNIWDGLYKGMEVLRKIEGKNSAIFLLTDGMPNIVPPRGHLPMLQKYKDEHGLPGIINTFGFGYSLDSKLLHELAVEGNGAYAFIPDGSFVGTIFVNALSNLLSTVATNVCLSVELDQKVTPDYSLISQSKHQVTSWGLEMQLGSVLFGQSKQIVIPFTIDPEKKLAVTLKYETHFENAPIKFSQELEVQNKEEPQIEVQSFRLEFVNEVNKALELRSTGSNDCVKVIKDLAAKIKSSKVANVKFVKDLLADLEGQSLMAVEKIDPFNKWGKHFLPSLIRAHLLQQCNNFKDPGVQNYGGEVFNKIRDQIDDIFVKLPPPKPTVKKAEPYKPVQNMKVFYNAGGGCIDGTCLVQMADGSIKLVQDIVKGDLVSTINGQSAKVRCVVKTICKDSKAQLVQLESALRITAWHPIRLQGKFFFPCTVEQPFQYEFYNCPAVYNFVLEDHHLMIVNGVECVTLAHGFQEDVVRHEYYGTQAIIEDLMKLDGWNNGLVYLTSGDMRRDEKTGMVVGMTKMKTINSETVDESLSVSVI